MLSRLLGLGFCLFASLPSQAQWGQKKQYFDGADTNAANSIFVYIDTSSTNVWQIGKPQKLIFDSAYTLPNVIVTDTLNSYPLNDTSSFSFGFAPPWWGGILAFRWVQKLDLDYRKDGGLIEFSIDSGSTWYNVFDHPNVYNFYGFNNGNADTVAGEPMFTGTDSLWRDIWLCFTPGFIQDTVALRFTLLSDSVNTTNEGWMIDNIKAHQTIIHTVSETEKSSYFKVFPTKTSGVVFIEALQKGNKQNLLERVELIDASGRVVGRYRTSQEKYSIDISKYPPGMYHLRLFSNIKSKTFSIFLD